MVGEIEMVKCPLVVWWVWREMRVAWMRRGVVSGKVRGGGGG